MAAYTGKEYAEEKAEKRGLFLLVSVISLFIGFTFWLVDQESGFFILLLMLGLIAAIAFSWRFSDWVNWRQNRRGSGEAYVAREGVYVNRR